MTYDALLALRGWGRDDFATATGDFMAAVRFALFAERVGPILNSAEEIRDQPVDLRNDPASTRTLMKAKHQAEAAVDSLRDALYPEDDDG
jgi:hypothetical protein